MNRRFWTAPELAVLRKEYPHQRTPGIARKLRRTDRAVYQQALKMGLRKTDAYRREAVSPLFVARGAAHRFTPGHRTWNAGMKGWQAGGRAHLTKFKPGNRPGNWRPVGSERVNADGLLERKVSEPNHWKPVHVIYWQKHRGRVPRGKVIIFRDRNPRNIRMPNLACVSRAQLMGRNTIHRYPRELKAVIRMAKRLGREIEART